MNNKNIFRVLAVAFLLVLIGEIVGAVIILLPSTYMKIYDKYEIFILYLSTIGTFLTILIYIYKKEKYMLDKLKFKFSHFFIGLIIGIVLNLICAFGAILNGNLSLTIGKTTILSLIISFILVFIQSTSEELLCRLFIYQKLKNIGKSSFICIIVNSIFFGALHLGNEGITLLAVLNITFYGIFLSILIHYFDSIWLVSLMHTGWNYTQNFLLGLPNSGMPASYSLYTIKKSSNSFFYNTIFGVEGTGFCLVILVISILVTYLLCNKKKPIKN